MQKRGIFLLLLLVAELALAPFSPAGQALEISEISSLDATTNEKALIQVLVQNTGNAMTQVGLEAHIENKNGAIFVFSRQQNWVAAGQTTNFVLDQWKPEKAGAYGVSVSIFNEQNGQKIAEKNHAMLVSGFFRVDIAIAEWRKVVRIDSDQNFILMLDNQGETYDDLLLKYWIEDQNQQTIVSESLSLAVPVGKKQFSALLLPVSKTTLPGTYWLKAEIRPYNRVSPAETREQPFEVVPPVQYRARVIQELEGLLKGLSNEIAAKQFPQFDTKEARQRFNELSQELATFKNEQHSLGEEPFDRIADKTRFEALEITVSLQSLPDRTHFFYFIAALAIAVYLLWFDWMMQILEKKRAKRVS